MVSGEASTTGVVVVDDNAKTAVNKREVVETIVEREKRKKFLLGI